MKKKKIGLLIIAAVVLMLLVAWQKMQRFAGSPLAIEKETIFTLPAGTGREGLETLLLDQKIITDGVFFRGCCVLSLSWLNSKRVRIALLRE